MDAQNVETLTGCYAMLHKYMGKVLSVTWYNILRAGKGLT